MPKDENDPLGLVELAKVLGEIEAAADAALKLKADAEPVPEETDLPEKQPEKPDTDPP